MKNVLMILLFVVGLLVGYVLSSLSNSGSTNPKFIAVDTVSIKDTIIQTDTVCYDGYKDGFVEFVAQFESDKNFRTKRCKLPLQVSFPIGECGSDLDTVNATLKQLDSLGINIGPMLSPDDNWSFIKGFNKNKPNELKRKILILRDETGVHVEYFFEYIEEQWMLVAIEDSSC